MTREDGSTVDDNKQQELLKADPDKEKCMRNYDSEEKTSENEVTSSEVVLISSSDSGSDIDISGIDTVTVLSSDSDSVSDVDANTNSRSTKRRKNIRRILDVAELGEETKKKIAIEKERQERLRSLKVTESLMVGLGVEVPDNASSGYIINLAREEDEEAVRISPSISEKLKPHQISGIRFMWENTIQSVRKVKSGDRGMGCILAHTMGLGKTFQVIAFLYTAMRCADMRLNTALILTPVTVLHNWRHEFLKWRPSELKPLQIFMLEDVPREKRLELLMKWKTKGGVFLIGYTAFRNLALGKGKYLKDPNMAREISNVLQVGPDILVCDEAHLIKNTMADTTQALKQVKCQRRIALTGSPLQNNLMEYYCMVDFVREGYLGSCHEFRNRFQNPIENGQLADATAKDVKIMNQRSHILYKELKGFIHRMGSNIVKNDLPPKTVFVIAVKLSTLQKKLYKSFLDVHGFTKGKASGDKKSFFAGYQALAQILNHPGILQMMKENKDRSKPEDLERCLADESSGDENIEYNVISGEKPQNAKKNLSNAFVCNQDWWSSLLQENNFKEVDYSGKMVLLLDILTMCSDIGDKVLVFSQSLSTLDLVEHYLSRLPCPGTNGKCWKKGKDWYRLDGRTESLERQRLVERFNEPLNKRAKCVLISTRAGSLGINLYSANRVIIVDGSWNPTYDLQAIYRVWRYGQTKPVFAYRLMAHATMEEKIYKRQVIKEGLAARVVDRQQVHRTMSRDEMLDLFDFVDEESTHVLCESGQEHVVEKPNMMGSVGDLFKQRQLPSLGASSDKVMQSLINTHKPRWIFSYHEHETLLQENEDEKLSKEEQDLAWEGYKKELKSKDACAPLNDQQKISIDPSTVRQLQSSTAQSAHDPKLVPSSVEVPENNPSTRATSHHEKCTELSHILTLRSQGTKMGCSTICGKCDREISLTDY